MGIIKKVLNKINSGGQLKAAPDSFIMTDTIYNGRLNHIILITFTEEHFVDAMEFLAIDRTTNIKMVFVNSSYKECVETEDGNKFIEHKRFYIVTSGSNEDYIYLLCNCWSLSNNIIKSIIKEIYIHRDPKDYKDLIDDQILLSKEFHHNKLNRVQYDNPLEVKIFDNMLYYCDNVSQIKNKLPETILGRQILDIIHCYTEYDDIDTLFYVIKSKITDNEYKEEFRQACFNAFKDIISECIKNPTMETMINISGPLYNILEDDQLSGEISDETLDEIFRQAYERFTIITPDESITYQSIDEVVAYSDGEEDLE